jgi:hypothetical protein
LHDGPRRAERGLLVAHLHVAPREEVEQLSVGPDLAEIEAEAGADGHDPHERFGGERGQNGNRRARPGDARAPRAERRGLPRDAFERARAFLCVHSHPLKLSGAARGSVAR